MMMCQQAVENITNDDEGRLTGWPRVAYRFHMAICPFCRAHRHQMHKTTGALAALPKDPPSEAALERATAAFKNRVGASKP